MPRDEFADTAAARLNRADPNGWDVCCVQPDPERPSPVTVQAHDDLHDHDNGITFPTGHDVFNRAPWKATDQVLLDLEHERAAELAKEALARMEAHLPPGAAERKGIPVATGFIDYFPDAIAAVARLSKIGNDQHNPGSPLHWDRSKSTDEADTLMRHFLDRGTFDSDGVRHSVKVAWRALALLQKEIEDAKGRLEPVFRG